MYCYLCLGPISDVSQSHLKSILDCSLLLLGEDPGMGMDQRYKALTYECIFTAFVNFDGSLPLFVR